MDNFVFNLQLFAADVTVDLTGAKPEGSSSTLAQLTKRAYVLDGETNYKWVGYGASVPEDAIATLDSGVLTIKAVAGKTVDVSNVTQEELAGVAIKTKATLDGAAASTKISLGGSEKTITASVLKFSTKGIVVDDDEAVTVSSDGVISNITANKSFSVYDSISDTLATKYSVSEATTEGKVSIVVGGDMAGIYTGITLEGATITLKDGADTVTAGGNTTAATPVTFAADAQFQPKGAGTAATQYYAVTSNGTNLVVDGTTPATEAANGAVGYLKVTYDQDDKINPNVKIEFVGTDVTFAGEKGSGGTASKLLGGITVDATNLDEIGDGYKVVDITIVSGTATGTVEVIKVPTAADVTGATEGKVSYVDTYSISETALTIDLSGLSSAAEGTKKFFAITDTDGTHGKHTLSIAGSSTYTAGTSKGGFLVEVTKVDGKNVYKVSYVAGKTGSRYEHLTDDGWANIKVNATGLSGKLVITEDNNGEDDTTKDKYTVTAPVGLVVDVPQSADYAHAIAGVTRTSTVAASIKYVGASVTAITLPEGDGPVKEYWNVVASTAEGDNKDGKPTVTLKKVEESNKGTDYITVDKDAEGNFIITYASDSNPKIALNGLADKVAINAAGTSLGKKLILTDDADNKVDYAVTNIAQGTTVVGNDEADTLAYNTATTKAYNNNIVIKELGKITTTTYYQITDTAATAATGVNVLTLGTAYGRKPAVTATYVEVKVETNETGAKTYTISYNKGDNGVDLAGTSVVGGAITVDATGVAKADGIKLVNNISTTETPQNTVKDYKVINVISGGIDGGIKVDTDDASDVKYVPGYKLALEEETTAISLNANIGKRYEVAKSPTAPLGVTTYTLKNAKESVTGSYFTVSVDETGKATLTFLEGGEGSVTRKELSDNLKDAFPVDGTGATATTLELTDDTKGTINYAVTNLPKTLTVTGNGDGDTISYTPSYEFAEGGNKLALNLLTDAEGKTTVNKDAGYIYYEVTATGGNTATKGVYSCTINGGQTVKAEDLSKLASKNYFLAQTDASGNVTVTYHEAVVTETEANPTKLALSGGLTVDVDPTNAATGAKGSPVNFKFGKEEGGDTAINFNVTKMTAYQDAAKNGSSTASVSESYVSSYAVTYADSDTGSIALDKTLAEAGGNVSRYYEVESSGGDTSKNGVTTINIKAAAESAPSGKAYFLVTYKSKYVVAVTYVNPEGESKSLTADGVPQIVINADGLASTSVDTIDITDTTGGKFNGVNYALTNVPATVTSLPGKNDGDTVSYKAAAVLADGSTITVDGTKEEQYFVVTSTASANNLHTCKVSAWTPGTGETKPADTLNYFSVVKNGTTYAIKYHMAEGEGGLGLSKDTSTLSVNVAGVTVTPTSTTNTGVTTEAAGKVEISNGSGIAIAVTDAAGGVELATDTTDATISYNTKFAWATGTYYVENPATDIEVGKGTASGATVGTKEYMVLTVTKKTTLVSEGKSTDEYTVTVGAKTKKADTTTGALTTDGTGAPAVGKITMVLPEDVTNFNANNNAFKAITGVTDGDVLADVNTATVVTTAKLSEGDQVTVGIKDVAKYTYTAGAEGSLTITNGLVTDGTIALSAADDAMGSAVSLEKAADGDKAGVNVTFASSVVKAITGLDKGDKVKVGGTYYSYTSDGKYIAKSYTDTESNVVVEYTAVSDTTPTANILDLTYAAAKTVAVGKFVANAKGTYYIAATSDGAVLAENAEFTSEAATAGTTYIKAVVAEDNTTLSISTVKGNSMGLVDASTDYKGTIEIPAATSLDGVVTFDGTASADSDYKLKFTGVKAGSSFKYLDSDDTIVTDKLAKDTSITIKTKSEGADAEATYTAAANDSVLTFNGAALVDGTVTLNEAAKTLIAGDSTTISYTKSTAETDGVTVVFGKDEKGVATITSITGLAKDESVTMKASDGTETKYKAEGDTNTGTTITRTITKNGESVKTTLTVDVTEGVQSNILKGKEGSKTFVNDFAWADGKVGYFKLTESGGVAMASVPNAADTTQDTLTANDTYIKAEVSYVNGTSAADGFKLELTPQIVTADGTFADTKLYSGKVNVAVPDTTIVKYDGTGKSYNVALTNVAAGSTLTLNQKGDTVAMAATTAGISEITINKTTYKTGANDANGLKFYAASSNDIRVQSGAIVVDGTMKSVTSAAKDGATVVYTAGTAAGEKTDGAIVTFTDGAVSSITDLTKGEKVTITDSTGTTTYEAHTNDIIWKTVGNVTTVRKLGATDGSVNVIGIADDYKTVTPLKATGFATKYAADSADGYFLVTDGTVAIASQTKDAEVATYQNAGAKVVKATVASNGAISFTYGMVNELGTVASWTALTDASGTGITQINVTLAGNEKTDTATPTITKVASATMNVTGAGNGTVFKDFADGDTVSTGTLSEGNKVTFDTTTYTAGGTGKLTFNGNKVVSGVFNIKDNTSTPFTAANTDSTTKVTTVSNLTYTPGDTADTDNPGQKTDGANVTVSEGKITGITGLNLGETVSFTTTETAKDGTVTTTVTKYEAANSAGTSGVYKGMIKVTKTETINGVKTEYYQYFSNDTTSVTKKEGWTVSSATTNTFFQFGDTTDKHTAVGYFAATPATDGENKGKYSADIAAQDANNVLGDAESDAGYYLKVTAEKHTAGDVAITKVELVKLEKTGAWTPVTNEEVYSVNLTAPKGVKLALPEHTYDVNITLADKTADCTFSGLNANDKVTAEGLKGGASITVNDKKYTASDDNTIVVKGDNIVSGTVVIGSGSTLTADADGAIVAYTAKSGAAANEAGGNGVKVVFSETGGITSITDLDSGESVVVTAKDGTITTYTRNDTTYTKTVKVGDQTAVWTKAENTAQDAVTLNYGVTETFSWPTDSTKESVGYFKVSGNKATIQTVSTTGSHEVGANDEIVRAVVTKTETGYAITSLKLLKGQNLTDITGTAYNKTSAANPVTQVAVTIKVPSEENITVAVDGAITLPKATTDNPDVDRNVQLNVTGVQAGQTITGLADTDTVTTGQLKADDTITVGTKTFAKAEAGTLKVQGDGTALSGGFKLSNAYSISTVNGGTTTVVKFSSKNSADDAMAVVVNGQIQSIFKMNSGETITVTETTSAGAKKVTTYTAAASGDKIVVTKETVADGVTTKEITKPIADGADIVSAEFKTAEDGNSITTQFNWTVANGSGYFQLTDAKGALLADTLTIDTQKKQTIDAKDVNKVYAKVSVTEDYKIDSISLYEVQADGTLKATTLPTGTDVAVVINAPDNNALKADLTADTGNAFKAVKSVQVLGAAAGSEITLRNTDSLVTATLGKGEKVKVNNQDFTAAASTALKFTANATPAAVLADGTVTMPAGSFIAAGISSVSTDDVAINITGAPATITVTNGVVTAISGQTGDGNTVQTVTTGGADITYTYDGTRYNVTAVGGTTTGEVVFAALADGATVTGTGISYISGANNNSLVLYNGQLKSGVVKAANNVTVTAMGADGTTDDDNISVKYTGTGNAVVTVEKGKVTSIKGLNDVGDTVVVTATKAGTQTDGTTIADVVTTYTVTAAGTITKTVRVGTDAASAAQTAYVAKDADLLNANFIGGTTTDKAETLKGQFNWNTAISGRNVGYFDITEKHGKKTATVVEQPVEKDAVAKGTAANPVTKKYVVATLDGNELSLGALTVENNGISTTTTVLDVTKDFTASDMITISAPTTAIVYDKASAEFGVTINKLAARSVIKSLDTGDKVTTATLEAGQSVTFDTANTYTAGAKDVLTFVGEGTTADASHKVALQSGTIKLAGGVTATANLAGATDATTDDAVVTNNSDDDVVVKVKNGVVTSITGLTDENVAKNVTITNATITIGSGKSAVAYSGATIVYNCIGGDGKMFKRTVYATSDTSKDSVNVGYLNITKAGGEIVSSSYKDAVWRDYSNLDFSATGTAKTTTAYYKGTVTATTSAANMVTKDTVETLGDTKGESQFVPEPDKYYLAVTAKTTQDGVTTISSVDVYKSGATGALTKDTKNAFEGTLTIDGTTGMSKTATDAYDKKYAVINYTLPKNGTFDVVATGVSYKSKFVNLGEGDNITTAQITEAVKLEGGTRGTTYNIYKGYAAGETGDAGVTFEKAYTAARTITVVGDGVSITTKANGDIDTLTGLHTRGDKITITKTSQFATSTTIYEVKTAGEVIKTETASDGTKTVTKAAVADENTDVLDLAAEAWTAVSDATVVSTFDWTLRKNSTGYFAVDRENAAEAKANIAKISKANASTNYIAVEIQGNGWVKKVSQVKFDTTDGTMKPTDTATAFKGTLTLSAPASDDFVFARSALDADTIDASAKLAITKIITHSEVNDLVAGDTVATAKLKKGDWVEINEDTYTAGTNSALKFKMADVVIDGTTYENKATLTSGTAFLSGTSDAAGVGHIYAGNNLIKVTKGDGITVTATTNRNTTTYTIGDLGENESFTVGGVTYLKSGNTLFREDENGNTAVFSKTVSSSVSSTLLNTTNNWKDVKTTFTDGEDGTEQVTTLGKATADLALTDKRVAADKKAAEKAGIEYAFPGDGYDYVLDKYVSKTTTHKALNAAVVADRADWQVKIGVAEALNSAVYTYQYTAIGTIGQAINVAKNWAAVGSGYDDTITGAASGKDFIRGGAGDDTITLSGAEDTVAFKLATDGHNIVSKYISGKDQIILDDGDTTATTAGTYKNDFSVYLDTKANNVYLYTDNGDGKYDKTTDDGSVMLKGMGTGKAVKINGKDYYFGNGTLLGSRKTTKDGKTFTYAEGAYYYGNDSGKNALKVTTDKTKYSETKYSAKTLGDDVVIDLTKVDGDGRALYNNIQTVDASASANRVVLTAAATGSTLKGGTYQSTLKSGAGNDTLTGGTGKDMFWFDDLNGNDTVNSYISSKDAVYIGGNGDLSAYTIKADGTNVVITKKGDSTSSLTIAKAVNAAKAITVSTDGKVDGKSVSYFVGKAGTAKNMAANIFTVFDKTSYYIGNDTATDTIKLAAKNVGATIDLSNTSQYQSIDVIDGSKVEFSEKRDTGYTKDTSGMTITTGTNAVTVKGSIYADTININEEGKATISYAKVAHANGDVVKGFDVDDVIQINGLKDVSFTQVKDSEGIDIANTYKVTSSNGLSMTVETTGGKLSYTKTGTNKYEIKTSNS